MDEPDVPPPTVVCIASCKNIHEWINGHVINVSQTMSINFKFGSIGADTNNPAAQHGDFFSIRSFGIDHSEISNSYVNPPINPKLNPICGVIGTSFLITFSDTYVSHQILRRSICLAIQIMVHKNRKMHP